MCYFTSVGAGRVERLQTGRAVELRTIAPFAPSYRHEGKRDSELQTGWKKLLLFTQKQADYSYHRMYSYLQLYIKKFKLTYEYMFIYTLMEFIHNQL